MLKLIVIMLLVSIAVSQCPQLKPYIHIDTKMAQVCQGEGITFVSFNCAQIGMTVSAVGKINFAGLFSTILIDAETQGTHFRSILYAPDGLFRSPSRHSINGGSPYQLQLQLNFKTRGQFTWGIDITGSDIQSYTKFTEAEVVARFNDASTVKAPVSAQLIIHFQVADYIQNTDILKINPGQLVNISPKKIFGCLSQGYFYKYYSQAADCSQKLILVNRRTIKISQIEMDRIKGLIPTDTVAQNPLGDRQIKLVGAPCLLQGT